jgi:hypothetical protein
VRDQLVVGRHRRVAILLATTTGNPKIYARATSEDAIGEVLGLLAGLDIRVPERRAALDHIRRALESAAIDVSIPKPATRETHAWTDALDCADGVGSCVDGIDVVSSCTPDCDIGCDLPDPGCI